MKQDAAQLAFGKLLKHLVDGVERSREFIARDKIARGKSEPKTTLRLAFAKQMGVSDTTVKKWISGRRLPHSRQIPLMLELFFDDIESSKGQWEELRRLYQEAKGVQRPREAWDGNLRALDSQEQAMVSAVAVASAPPTAPWRGRLFGSDGVTTWTSLIEKGVLADAKGQLPKALRLSVREHLVEVATHEIANGSPDLLRRLPLVDTLETHDAIIQRVEDVLKGISKSVASLGMLSGAIISSLTSMLVDARKAKDSTYLAGNLINLLAVVRGDLSDLDLGCLTIRHAFLSNSIMQRTSLSKSRLLNCMFADTFGSIWQVGFRRDSRNVLASSVTGAVREHDVATGATAQIYGSSPENGHRGWSFGFAEGATRVASAGGDGQVIVWSKEGQLEARFEGHTSRVRAVGFLHDQSIVSCSEDRKVYRWRKTFSDLTRREELYEHGDRSATLAVDPSGKLVATGSANGEIIVYSLDRGSVLATWRAHDKEVRCVRFSRDGSTLVSAGDDRHVRIWRLPECELEYQLAVSEPTKAVCFRGSDNLVVLTGSDSGKIRAWRLPGAQPYLTWEGHTNVVRSVETTPDGALLVSGGDDQTVRIWDLNGEIAPGRPPLLRSYSGYLSQVRALAFGPLGAFASAHDDGHIHLWQVRDDEPPFSEPRKSHRGRIRAHHGRIWSLAFLMDGELLASAGEDGLIHLWQPGSLLPRWTWSGHEYRVFAIASRDTPASLVASGGSDKTVRFWTLDSSDPVQTIDSEAGHKGRVRDVSFSWDGGMLASAGEDGQVMLWVEEGDVWVRKKSFTASAAVTSVRFTGSDDRLVFVTEAGSLICWSWLDDAHREVRVCKHPLLSVTLDAAGETAIAGSQDGLIYPVALATMQPGEPVRFHSDWVEQVLFSPGGGFFASASDDQFIGIFDSRSHKRLAGFKAELPYEGLRIDGAEIDAAEREKLRALGAIDSSSTTSGPSIK